MVRTRLLAAAFAAGAVVAPAATAATLFENTWNGSSSGNCAFECLDGQVGAAQFTLLEDSVVAGFTLDTLYDRRKDGDGVTVNWAFRSDAGTVPGNTVLAQGSGAVPSLENFGQVGNTVYDRVVFDVAIPETSLDAGTYWLTLRLGVPNSSFTYYWAAAANGSPSAQFSGGIWTPNYGGISSGVTFSIRGTEEDPGVGVIPLPASLPLLLAALGGFALLRRRTG